MSERFTKFGENEIIMSKINLADANKILIPVMSSITKYTLGDINLFSHFKNEDIDAIQNLCCKYIVFKETGKNLTLLDISRNMIDLMPLLFEFLEFNFGFFSQALNIQKKIGGLILEREETKGKT